ncbi:hypothetical protein VP018_001433 [Morganella morganii]|nr:hypothetical protein [Morganella morganii]
MRLNNGLIINYKMKHQSYKDSLDGELEDLRRIHRNLTYNGGILNSEARMYIDSYYRIINDSDFKDRMEGKREKYAECYELINKIAMVIENVDYEDIKVTGGIFKIPEDKEKLTKLYNEMARISSVLSNPDTTKEQALKELEVYNNLMKNQKNVKLLNNITNDISAKARVISSEIQDYFIRQDMVTFGYFVDRMDNASRYSYDISVKYHRESINKYVDYYKNLTTKLNTFGDYIKDSINDGKQNKVYKRRFYTDIYDAMSPYFYYGDGKGFILYENNIKIVKVGDDKFNVLIGDELVDKEISYKEAYGKMEYFFSCHEPVIKGTRLCKLLKPIKDNNGNISGLEGKVEQFLFPTEFYYFMDFAFHEKKLDRINENFDKIFKGDPSRLSNWNEVTEKSIAASSDVEYTKEVLEDNYSPGIYDYFTDKNKRDEPSSFYQHEINTMNQKIDGAKKGLQLTLDEYTQRYNTINSNYDNMLRTITTMISELAQELKGFLRF